jgi:hypothetical protein
MRGLLSTLLSMRFELHYKGSVSGNEVEGRMPNLIA